MKRQAAAGLPLAVFTLLALVGSACSERADPRVIVGHWQAENFRLQGLGLPLGPEMDITESALAVTGTDVRVPVERIEVKGNEVTLMLPLGLSLSFVMDGRDRMSFDAPVMGPLHYRRTPLRAAQDAPPPAAAARSAQPQPPRPPPPASAQAAAAPSNPLAEVTQALARADADQALRRLADGLHSGQLPPAVLDDPRLSPVADDPRYRALRARHR